MKKVVTSEEDRLVAVDGKEVSVYAIEASPEAGSDAVALVRTVAGRRTALFEGSAEEAAAALAAIAEGAGDAERAPRMASDDKWMLLLALLVASTTAMTIGQTLGSSIEKAGATVAAALGKGRP